MTRSFVTLLFLSSTTAFAAADRHLDCKSYSKAYDLRITVKKSSAIVDVVTSTAKGDTALPEEKITLAERVALSDGWVGFEGKSSQGHHVTFKVKSSDLNRQGALKASLAISPDWTDTEDQMNDLDCVRGGSAN